MYICIYIYIYHICVYIYIYIHTHALLVYLVVWDLVKPRKAGKQVGQQAAWARGKRITSYRHLEHGNLSRCGNIGKPIDPKSPLQFV